MPLDGSNNYQYPPGTPGIPDTTIESNSYNTFLDDLVVNDLNIARPIHRGGTGAVNAHDAMVNLSGEIAGQLVTNYDSHLFVNGSFYSEAGATAAPSANSFDGICYLHTSNPTYGFIEARDLSTNILYLRKKSAGVWSAWVAQPGSAADLDAAYVNVTGDTMTGSLNINGNAGLNLNSPNDYSPQINIAHTGNTPGSATYIILNRARTGPNPVVDGDALGALQWNGFYNGAMRPAVSIGSSVNGTPSSDSVPGHLLFATTPGAGVGLTERMKIAANGTITMGGPLILNGTVTAGSGGTTGTYYFGNTGTKYLSYDGSFFNFTGAPLICPALYSTGGITAGNGGTTGYYYFGNTGTKYLNYNGADYSLVGGGLFCGAITATGMVYSAGLSINTPDYSVIEFNRSGTHLWQLRGSSPGGNDFEIHRYNGATYLGSPLQLNSSGETVLGGTLKMRGAYSKQGESGSYGPNRWNFYWNNAALEMWIDSTYIGVINTSSDYRIKKDVVDLSSTWDIVKQLRPVKYTQAQFTLPTQIAADVKEKQEQEKLNEKLPDGQKIELKNYTPTFTADSKERWGFIAHELQATMIMDAATGVKDSPDTVQSPNPWTIIAALTKTIQEMQVRIEALEAA